MPTVRDIAGPLADICTAVPYESEAVCGLCHGHPNPGYARCYSCEQTRAQVSKPCGLIVPVSLYEIPSQLHFVLRHYKSGVYPHRQRELALQMAALLSYFLLRHRSCITAAAGADWNVITNVPSTSRSGEHPLVAALRRVPAVFASYEALLRRGPATIDHTRADDHGYSAVRHVVGERVLLVDDTFTSGARAQSAASALRNAGAEVVAIVPVGRVINPQWRDNREWWHAQRRVGFNFATCCLEPF